MKPQAIVVILACVVGFIAQIAFVAIRAGAMMWQDQDAPVAVNFGVQRGGGFAMRDFAPADPVPLEDVQPVPQEAVAGLRGPLTAVRDCTVSGPFTHANLSVFLIHGPDTMKEQAILPLQAALEQNAAVVHAGLSIDNFGAAPVFIQAGDIVKGGTQDRTLPYDLLVMPGARGVHLAAYCVEAGRSSPRGQELSTSFQTATEQLPGKHLNLAARYRHSQNDVWDGVRQTQMALARNLGGPVQSPLSQTSLQLTLENDRVQTALQGYLNQLAAVPAREKNVIGAALVVNGQFETADVYANSGLFQSLWPKLLKAGTVAALAERDMGQPAAVPSTDAVQQFLADAEAGQSCEQRRTNSTLVLRQESARALLFDTCDVNQQNLVVHRSFLAK